MSFKLGSNSEKLFSDAERFKMRRHYLIRSSAQGGGQCAVHHVMAHVFVAQWGTPKRFVNSSGSR